MGAGPRSLLIVLFRMIPRFPPMRSMCECATPTTPGHTEATRAPAEPPTSVQPASHDPQPREPPHPKHSPMSQMS